MHSIPTVYKSVQKTASILFMIIGVVAFLIMPIIIAVIILSINPELLDDINPFRHYLTLFYVGPILLIVGGILSIIDQRNQEKE